MRKLILGNLNYSSWSIRPLLVARKAGLEIEEQIIPLDFPDTRALLKEISPTARVPLLIWDGLEIWDSLAITEFLAEQAAPGAVWPTQPEARAAARAAAAEMHAGFPALRSDAWMDIRARKETPEMTDALNTDVTRVLTLWSDLRRQFGSGGDFLLGQWSAADAFFAPVVTRFRTWNLPLDETGKTYSAAVFADPAMQRLETEAEAEPWWIDYDETGRSSGYVKDTASS
jgi:glutathione S-transferase